MKYMLALITAFALSAPAYGQETETLPDGRKVRIETKDGTVVIKEVDEVDEAELPEDVQEILKRFRKQMEEMRKDMEERMKKVREELEKSTEDLENDPDAEVKEYEHKSADGKTHVKVKIVRVRKSSKSETPEAPEAPKKASERKQ